jgi:hypothetical protein
MATAKMQKNRKNQRLGWILAAQAVLAVSYLVLRLELEEEPFLSVRSTEVWMLVALPVFLFCFQVTITLALAYLVAIYIRNYRRICMVLLLVVGIIICLALLRIPRDYIGDIEKFTLPRSMLSSLGCSPTTDR